MKLIVIAFVLVICLPGIAFAGVDFTPHPGYDAPNYFSGTNARAFYKADLNGPSLHIEASELSLNGQVVASHTYPISGPPTKPLYIVSCSSAVMFDSSHFQHRSDVIVKYRVKTGGVWYQDTR